MRRSEDLEVVETLSEPFRVKGVVTEEVLGEDLGEESEPGAGGAWVVWVRLNEEEAVLRAKPGSGDDVVALCKGVTGALTLPPPPPPPP